MAAQRAARAGGSSARQRSGHARLQGRQPPGQGAGGRPARLGAALVRARAIDPGAHAVVATECVAGPALRAGALTSQGTASAPSNCTCALVLSRSSCGADQRGAAEADAAAIILQRSVHRHALQSCGCLPSFSGPARCPALSPCPQSLYPPRRRKTQPRLPLSTTATRSRASQFSHIPAHSPRRAPPQHPPSYPPPVAERSPAGSSPPPARSRAMALRRLAQRAPLQQWSRVASSSRVYAQSYATESKGPGARPARAAPVACVWVAGTAPRSTPSLATSASAARSVRGVRRVGRHRLGAVQAAGAAAGRHGGGGRQGRRPAGRPGRRAGPQRCALRGGRAGRAGGARALGAWRP
jgi:hypothetical protein